MMELDKITAQGILFFTVSFCDWSLHFVIPLIFCVAITILEQVCSSYLWQIVALQFVIK